jgi:hypothetical protein
MLVRVPQRTSTDCAIAVVATVMGTPYSYERVLADSARYQRFTSDGQFSAWWETYFWDSGFPNQYRPLSQLWQLVGTGEVAGMLMLGPTGGEKRGHVVAIDERGIINPATNWPDRIRSVDELLQEYVRLGCRYEPDKDFLAVRVGGAP